MSQQDTRADFSCPSCDSSDIFRVGNTDGTYECQQCGERTHEKIEAARQDLEDLADSDSPASKLAAKLVGDVE